MSQLKSRSRLIFLAVLGLAGVLAFFLIKEKERAAQVASSAPSASGKSIWKMSQGTSAASIDIAGYNVLASRLNLTAQEPHPVINTDSSSSYQQPLQTIKPVKTYPVARNQYPIQPIEKVEGSTVKSRAYPAPLSPVTVKEKS